MYTQDLNSLKYPELQKLAKSVGIRANQKIEKLIKALRTYYESESSSDEKCFSPELKAPASKENGLASRSSSSGTGKSTPLGKVLNKRKSDGKNVHTPTNPIRERKRPRTFELDEAKKVKGSTPTIDRLHNVHRFSSQAEKNTENAPKRQRTSTLEKKFPSVLQSGGKKETPLPASGRKRRGTFDLDEASVKGSTPTIDGQLDTKKRRHSSQRASSASENCDENVRTSSSPSTRAIIEAIDANCSSTERRERLLSAISLKVQSKAPTKSSHTSQIPRFTTFIVNKKKESQNPVTPGNKDWKKIHNKEFSKFDSIDVYLNKKKQRQDQLSSSTKKTLPFGSPAGKTRPAVAKPVYKNPAVTKVFQPQVTSTKNLSFNFSKVAPLSARKTPSRNPVTPAKTSNKPSGLKTGLNTTVGGRATPYRFTGNTNTNSVKKSAPSKPTFDLKASLAKPVSWKPHTGKLQSVDVNKGPSVPTQRTKGPLAHRALASKTKHAKVKDVRRAAVVDRRSNQKYVDMMRKRGLLA